MGASLGGVAALLFLPAGRLDWVAAWLYLGIVTANGAVNYAYLSRRNPELIRHRMRFGKGTKTWDKLWAGAFTPVFMSVYVVAGLDAVRFGWSAMPLWLWPLGLVLFLPGTTLFTWIDTGPYRLVRHPGYLGFLGWILSAPMLLGSWWAFVPAALSLVGLVVRTALEDRTLRQELPGYAGYAARVRFRLIPGFW
jgi:protein-S-isoprenylcysteine O-methyltransferase Ste14